MIRPLSVVQTGAFRDWLLGLRDQRARDRILMRIRRVEVGNFGDCKTVGGRIQEMRIDYGPGYRLYFERRGDMIVVLLCGGDKGSQARDIARAAQLAREAWQ
jgi:putative addiction module killer protein